MNTSTSNANTTDTFGEDSDTEIAVTPTEGTNKKKKIPDISHSDLAEASIGQMLNSLLEKVFSTQDLSELNTIATILQRLIATRQQVFSLRGQLQEGAGTDSSRGDGLDTHTVRELERQLKLL
ncbi:MAG: hypothetical protein LBB26_04425 [Puniceicoccales bacterium]|jgi:hypothetical protein|nr:hypothetical protein [Puniceicoccales bacterium]